MRGVLFAKNPHRRVRPVRSPGGPVSPGLGIIIAIRILRIRHATCTHVIVVPPPRVLCRQMLPVEQN